MTPRSHRSLALTCLAATGIAYHSLLRWNPNPGAETHLGDWLFSSEETTPQIYFLLAAALAFRNRRALRERMNGAGAPRLGLASLALGAAAYAWGHYTAAPDLLLVSFALVSLGAALSWFGPGFAAAWSIPCLVLAFAYPVPAVLANQIFYPLRLWTADQAAALLTLSGFSVFQEGNMIYGTDVAAHVIDSCSGLRAMEILTLAALFYVHWSPANRLRGWLLVALAPLVAYGFNLLRVCFIVRDPTSDLAATHTVQGWLTFLGALAAIVALDRLLGRLLPERPRAPLAPPRPVAQRESAMRAFERASERAGARSIATAALLVALALIAVAAPRWAPSGAEAGEMHGPWVSPTLALPLEMDGWAMREAIPLDVEYLWPVQFTSFASQPYSRDAVIVDLFVGEDDRRRRDRSLLSRKNALPGRGWEIESRSRAELEAAGVSVERVIARSGQRRIITYCWYEGIDGLGLEGLRALLATDQSPLRREQPARAIRIGTRIGAGASGVAEGERVLREFARALASSRDGTGAFMRSANAASNASGRRG
ncbi:MAG TPA: exosortase/archaeosortase family protein [Myxococcota bacterium]|nr:exosortase/archaeosortase family protein [Myxococcota bacterium]